MRKRVTFLLVFCILFVFMSGMISAKDKGEQERDARIAQKHVIKEDSKTTPTTTTTTDYTTTTFNQTSKDNQISNKALTGETINWWVIAGGGGTGSSTNYTLSGTAGQFVAGLGTSTNYIVNSGFWQNFSSGGGGCCVGERGDTNNDGGFDVSDVVYMVNWIFKEGPIHDCAEEADVVIDGSPDVSDLVYLVNYIFKDGPTLPPC